jgi:hypothetical protein
MTSAVYRQTNESDAERRKIDADNRYCWHRPMQRLEAEAIRDAMLAVSGQLDPHMYGPGTLDPDQRRRSIYFFVKRSKLVPMMMLFDAPDTLQDLAVRGETVIAPQSLLFMNNQAVRGYASAMATRIASSSPQSTNADEAAIVLGYKLALAREPTERELKTSKAFLAAERQAYRDEQRANADKLAWDDFCQVLFSLNEFIYIR